jgi:PAS domain S-box-containing protein
LRRPALLLQELNSIILVVTFALNISLAIYLFMKNRKSATNISFSAVILCLALWSISYVVWALWGNPVWIKFWSRMTFFVTALVPGFFLYFAEVFPKDEAISDKKHVIAIFIPSIVFAVASFTDLIAKGIASPYMEPMHGEMYPYFVIFLLAYLSYAFYIIFNKYLSTSGKEKLQYQYLLMGCFVTAVIGLLTNVLLVSNGMVSFGPIMTNTIGPASTLIMTGFVTYSIGRYKLLNIKNFFAVAALYALSFTLILGTLLIFSLRQLDFALSFYTIIANISLGGYVLYQNSRGRINRSFALITCLVALWVLTNYITDKAVNYEQALVFARSVMMTAAFIPSAFVYFTYAFLNRTSVAMPALYSLFFFVPSVFFFILSTTALLVPEVTIETWGVNFVYGPLFPLFVLYSVVYMLYGFIMLGVEYRRSSGIKKAQIGYLFLGTAIAVAVGIITNVILPALGITEFYRLGPSATIILIGFVTYSIVRHRLMNIEFVIQKGFIYTFITMMIMVVYAAAIVVSEKMLSHMFGLGSLIISFSAALMIALTFQPVMDLLQQVSDRFFFRARYDYQRTLSEVSTELATVMSIKQLSTYISKKIMDVIRVNEISFLMFDPVRRRYKSVPIDTNKINGEYKKLDMDPASRILSYIKDTNSILVSDEFELEVEDRKAKLAAAEERTPLVKLQDEVEKLGIALWAPVVSKGELIGVLALGNKISGDMYTAEDLRLLATLASQVAISVENARLYEEILTTKNYIEDILQSITSGVVSTDMSGRMITFNKAFEELVGANSKGLSGQDLVAKFSSSQDIKAHILDTYEGRAVCNVESELIRSENQKVPVSFSSVVLTDATGLRSGYLFVISDLSELKKLEDRVRQSDKLAALGNMAAGMAHEIKNPLSSMKVFSQLLRDRYEDPEFRKKFEEIIPKEIGRIDRIIEGLLSFARSPEPKLCECMFSDIMDEVLDDLSEEIERNNVKVEKNYVPSLPGKIDKDQIFRVFNNLVLNALQAMSGGGTLKIDIKPKDPQSRTVEIKITDTGLGIPKKNLSHIFDPFFTTKHYGTGLGLAITHSIIEAHKAMIDVESVEGQGTVFTITMPVLR